MTTTLPTPGRRVPPPAGNGAPKAAPRRTLASMVAPTTGEIEPAIILVVGPPGVGKTSFAASAPRPLMILTDRGGGRSVPRAIPRVLPAAWDDLPGDRSSQATVMGALRGLLLDEHDRQTAVIDTMNRGQALLWTWLCGLHKVTSVEAIGGGFGKGFNAALEKIEELISLLFELREQRGMNVILTSHQHVKTANNPMGDEYERWQLQLNDKAAGALVAAADTVIFAEPEVVARVEGQGPAQRKRGGSTGIIKAHVRPRQGLDA
ncbi:MAG TPA: ATP-binding protein, partial [Elusimicrobiota bacterium]|nr:ATP-binding protein [Elusimicrobiota bacterium]